MFVGKLKIFQESIYDFETCSCLFTRKKSQKIIRKKKTAECAEKKNRISTYSDWKRLSALVISLPDCFSVESKDSCIESQADLI